MPKNSIEDIHHNWRKANRLWKKSRKPILEPLNLTKTDAKILMTITKGCANTKSELADKLSFEPSAMTRSLDRLSERGLIKRYVSEEDKRFVKLEVTDEGVELVRQFKSAIHTIWRKVLKDVDESKLAAFEEVLETIKDKLKEHVESHKR